jgi:hypothetical protein
MLPTDAKLLHRACVWLVRFAKKQQRPLTADLWASWQGRVDEALVSATHTPSSSGALVERYGSFGPILALRSRCWPQHPRQNATR